MRDTLIKWELIRPFRMSLDISRKQFINRMRELVMEDTPGIYADLNEAIQPVDYIYVGDFDEEGFTIRPRQNLFGTAKRGEATGFYKEENGRLIIDGEITSYSQMYLILFCLSILFYGTIAFFIISAFAESLAVQISMVIIFILFYVALFAFASWAFRRSARKIEYEIKRDLFYLTRTGE